MRSVAPKIVPGFVIFILLVTMLACGTTSTPQQAPNTPQVVPTEPSYSDLYSNPDLLGSHSGFQSDQ